MKIPRFVKKILGDTRFYTFVRTRWCEYLSSRPHKRLAKHGIVVLKRVEEILSKTKAVYFADYGTLLGIVRDKSFCANDDDIDYSIMGGSVSPLDILNLFDGHEGFVFIRAFEFRRKITELRFSCKGVPIDFFFSYNKEDSMLTPGYYPPGETFCTKFGTVWRAYAHNRTCVFDRIGIFFGGVRITVPSNFEVLLSDTYGSWRIPVDSWSDTTPIDYGQNPRLEFRDCATIVDAKRVREIGFNKDIEL